MATVRRALVAGIALALTWVVADAAYESILSTPVSYDDEGGMLIALDSFVGGGALYDETFSPYGPFYFEFWGLIHELFGLDVNHDNGRLLTLIVWLLVSILCAIPVYRVTRDLALTAATQLGVFLVQVALVFEPMHPGGLISLLLAAIVALAALPVRPRYALFLLGALGSALALTKINVGGLALIALALAFVQLNPPRFRRGRAVVLGVGAIAVFVPFVLIGGELSTDYWREFAIHVSIAAAAVVIAGNLERPVATGVFGDLRWLIGGAVAAAAVISLAAVALGTGISGLVEGVVLRPIEQPDVFSREFVLPSWAPLWSLGCLVLLALALVHRRAGDRTGQSVDALVAAGRIAAGVLIGTVILSPDITEFSAYAVALPLAWVPLIGPARTREERAPLARRLLPPLAVLQALHVYPSAGSQTAWGEFLLIPIAAICVADGLADLKEIARPAGIETPARVGAVALSLAVLALTYHAVLGRGTFDFARAQYRDGLEVNGDGAERLRFPPPAANQLNGVLAEIRGRCSALVTLPGMNSFHLWTGIPTATGVNATGWMFVLHDDEERDIVEAVRGKPSLCVVRNRALVALWARGRPVPRGPLIRFIESEFSVSRRIGAYELMERAG